MPGGPKVNQLNLHRGVTKISQEIANLHWILLSICAVIFIIVFSVMFYSIWAHRKSKGYKASTFHENIGVEIAWTIIPFFIVIGMAIPATKTVLAMKDTTGADLTIKVTGFQWKWGYEYLDGTATGIKFLSNLSTPRSQIENREQKGQYYLMEVDNNIVVPINKKVRLMITSADVIHSWMVPDFGVKQDAIPGFLRDTWFRAEKPGLYRGQCAELCGKDHAFMPIVVEAISESDYEKWVLFQKKKLLDLADDPNKNWTKEELISRGKTVYESNCIACHQSTGRGLSGVFPSLDGTKIVLGKKENQIDVVLKGKPGTAMAAFENQLNDVEISAVITFIRHAWTNQGKGLDPIVLPKEIEKAH
ncbi:MAG: cytochrome c oxidase subunit II [Bordetella sp.]|nr:MAG: cytochrome c oxidase subunit II [Bordetella sp.]